MVACRRYCSPIRTSPAPSVLSAAQDPIALFWIGETNLARQKKGAVPSGGRGRVTAPRGKGARGRPGREGGGPPPCGRLYEGQRSIVRDLSIGDWVRRVYAHWESPPRSLATFAAVLVGTIANVMPSACLATSRSYPFRQRPVLPFRNRVDRVAMLCRSRACQGPRLHRL